MLSIDEALKLDPKDAWALGARGQPKSALGDHEVGIARPCHAELQKKDIISRAYAVNHHHHHCSSLLRTTSISCNGFAAERDRFDDS